MDRSIRYAVNGDVHIAYQVVGDGPLDLVYSHGIWSNVEVMWEWPAWARYLERLASGSMASFDGPARAIRCAVAAADARARPGDQGPGRHTHG